MLCKESVADILVHGKTHCGYGQYMAVLISTYVRMGSRPPPVYLDRSIELGPPSYNDHMAWAAQHPNGIRNEPYLSTASVDLDRDWYSSDSDSDVQPRAVERQPLRRAPIQVQHGTDEERATWTYIDDLPRNIYDMIEDNDIDGLIALGRDNIYAWRDEVEDWDRFPGEVVTALIGGVLHHVIAAQTASWDEYEVQPAVKALLDAGFDVNQRSFRGSTPLHTAMTTIEVGYDSTGQGQTREKLKSLVRTLVEAGADTSATNEIGETFVDVAMNANLDSQETLEEDLASGYLDRFVDIGKPFTDAIRWARPQGYPAAEALSAASQAEALSAV